MGTIFGKESVKEPPYEILLQRTNVKTPYELRKYATRYAASVEYSSENGTSEGFRTLAKYIGVFGTPQNEGTTNIAMTAPVVMEEEPTPTAGAAKEQKPTPIAMTAPVVMETNVTNSNTTNTTTRGMNKMMFMLPEEYDDITKIPKPTNPAVHIEKIPSEIGAVHRYNGNYNANINSKMAQLLGEQLLSDGLVDVTHEYAMEHFQFWGYNPPFTLPYFRRNEVWIKLNKDQVHFLKETFPSETSSLSSGGGGGSKSLSSSKNMSKTTVVGLGLCGLVLVACVVGNSFRSRSEYRRL